MHVVVQTVLHIGWSLISEIIVIADHIITRVVCQKGLYSRGKGLLALIHSHTRKSLPEKVISYAQ